MTSLEQTADDSMVFNRDTRLQECCLTTGKPNDIAAPRPLSPAQEGIWFYDQLLPRSPLYLIPSAIRVRGPLDVPALERAMNHAIARHDTLRAKIVLVEGKPMQVVERSLTFALTVSDISSLEEYLKERKINQLAHEEAVTGFDLCSGPLVRARLIRCSPEDHLLLLSLHHIIADQQSLEILFDEISLAYRTFAQAGEESLLPPVREERTEFAAYERKVAGDQKSRTDVEYWRTQLEGHSESFDFPTDFPRPPARNFKGSRVRFHLPLELTNDLKRISREKGTSFHCLLLTAFNVFLSRYSDQDEVMVGLPVSQREQFEVEHAIGFFVNTLPFRSQFAGDMAFDEALRRTKSASTEVYQHSQTPLLELVREYWPSSDLSRHPFFQIVFQFLSSPSPKLSLVGTTTELLPLESGTAKFDLIFNVAEEANGLNGEMEYASDLFARATVEQMLEHFKCLLGGIAADPTQKVSKLPLLTNQQKEALLVSNNQTKSNYPREATIHQLFEEQVRKAPGAIALRFGETAVSYDELNERADQFAHVLRNAGLSSGEPVGLSVQRSIEMIVGLLAILKAGGCYVPLDPRYPAERLRFLARDAGIRIILTLQEWKSCLPAEAKLLFMDQVEAAASTHHLAGLETSSEAGSPCYILYTSGSTGEPKGVEVPHRGVVRLVKETNYIKFKPTDVCLQFSTLSFDASTLEIWGALLNGATLVIFPPSFDSIEQLGSVLETHRINKLFLTTSLFHEVVNHHIDVLKSVETLVTGGEVLSSRCAAKFLQRYPQGELVNGYGPTENTTFSCCFRMRNQWNPDRAVPIGTPISNSTAYILDKHMNPVPMGAPGELYVGGDGVALGYVNRPELTSAKFIPNPFFPEEGTLYRTGDIVRYLPDGNIAFLGRRDNQVKVRGFRVELDEIEHALRQTELVQSAVVLEERDATGANALAAYVVPVGKEVTTAVLSERLSQKLPAYMIPARITLIDRIPITVNGKVDRKALAQLKGTDASRPEASIAANPVEEKLTKILEEVLQQSSIKRDENFFDRGLQSLLAMRIIAQINREFQRKLTISALFEAPSIAELAKKIASSAPANVQSIRSRTSR